MPLNSLGPMFETLVHAGLGLRVFQAFARSIPSPTPESSALYRFVFLLTQNLSDNEDRKPPVTPPTT